MDASTRNPTPQPADVELAKYLWEEYRYRHDLIWRLLFRMTGVAVLLSIAPFTIDDLANERTRGWVDALPALALALVVSSWIVLAFELRLFTPIDGEYTAAQNTAVGRAVRGETPKVFKWVVYLYPGVLLALLIVVALVAWSRTGSAG
jgi:hypothetical protein